MTNDDKWNSDVTWDMVADGPLDPSQLAELVAACERRPELWKLCALALLEEQALRCELQSIAREQLSATKSNERATRNNVTPLLCPAPSQRLESVQKTGATQAQPSEVTNRSNFWNNLALAAAIMIAFGIGWQSSLRFGLANRSLDTKGAPIDLIAAEGAGATVPKADTRPLPVGPDFMLANTAEVDRALIDQVNAQTLAQTVQVNLEDEVDPEYEQLKQRGYEVETQKGLMPVWLYDGRSTVVPYQQIQVRRKSLQRAY